MILFVEDNSERIKKFLDHCPEEIVVVRTAKMALEVLDSGFMIDVLFLDHDLGGEVYVDESERNTGSEIVRWLVGHQPLIRRIICHSMNTPARRHMVADLRKCGYEVWDAAYNVWDWGRLSSAWKNLG